MSNGENIVQTVKTAVQDVVAPDVRELKVKTEALREQIASVDKRLSEQIASVDKRLSEQIASVDKRLSEQIASVDKRLSEQIASLERHVSEKFEAANARSDAQFHAILAAINQSKAENELVVYKQVSALAERVTAIEVRLQQGEARAA